MGLRKAYAKVSHHKVIFFRDTFLTRPFFQQSISVRHSSFVESEDEDVEEEDVEDEPEPSAFNVACCGRRFRACFSGLTGPSGHGATFRGHGATVQIKQVGLTRSLRIPYAFLTRKNTFFFQNWFRGSNEHFSTRTNWTRGTGKTGFYRNRTV